MRYGYDILLPLMIDEPIAQKAEKNVFYVIRRGYKNRYLSAAPYSPYRETLEEAQRFESVNAALGRIKTMGGVENSTEIVRVEAITTPGKSTRVEVPLGDKPPYYAIGSDPGKYWTGNKEGGSKYTRNIYEAAIYAAQRPLLLALQRQAIGGMTPLSNARIIGIADITTPSTTTYTETVLA